MWWTLAIASTALWLAGSTAAAGGGEPPATLPVAPRGAPASSVEPATSAGLPDTAARPATESRPVGPTAGSSMVPALAAWTADRVRREMALPATARVHLFRHDTAVTLVLSWVRRPAAVRPGGAHLAEHLSYAAVQGHGPGGWDAALEQAGGWSEGWTDRDGVTGLIVAPPEATALALRLEGQRLDATALEPGRQGLMERQWAVLQAERREHAADPTAMVFRALFPGAHAYGQDPRQPAADGLSGLASWWTPEVVVVVLPQSLAPEVPPLPAPGAPATMAPVERPTGARPVEPVPGPARPHLAWRLPPCPDPAQRAGADRWARAMAAGLGGEPWSWWGEQGGVLAISLPKELVSRGAAESSTADLAAPPIDWSSVDWDGAAAAQAQAAPPPVQDPVGAAQAVLRARTPLAEDRGCTAPRWSDVRVIMGRGSPPGAPAGLGVP